MKKLITILLILTAFALVSCKDTVMELSNPDKSGSVLDLKNFGETIDFTTMTDNTYYDFQNVAYPVNEWKLLTAPKLSSGVFSIPDMPAIFHATQSPNYQLESQTVYNFGVDYTVKFRLTDDTTVTAPTITKQYTNNQPQGIVLTCIFLAGENAHGAIMAMIFKDNAFPSSLAGLDENVLLTLNYDGAGSGHLIAAADVPSLHSVDPAGEPVENDFHTATLRIHDDADETHGPTISLLIDGTEVIKYSNTGPSHSINPGVWDTESNDTTFADTVLGIKSYPAYFNDSRGVQVYNDSWKQALWKPSAEGPETSLITFGTMFQLGLKETNAGTSGSGAPGSSQYKSPEIASIDVKPYTTPAE